MRFIFLIAVLGGPYFLFSNDIVHINLNDLVRQDCESIHIILLKSRPNAKLVLPNIYNENAKYFDLFYTWDEKPDPSIDVMCIQHDDYDKLFIDYNNDEDLTNDGAPLLFQHSECCIEFDIPSNHDKLQKTRLILSRKPMVADSMLGFYLDGGGNMIKEYAKICGVLKGDFNFKGEKGSFYFDDRISVRRGNYISPGKKIALGIFDENNNGLYNDKDDLLFLDLNGDGKLYLYENELEVFKLSDIFSIFNQNYKIRNIDKYGKWIEIEKTNEKETFYYFKEAVQALQKTGLVRAVTAKLDSSFWESVFNDLDGNSIKMSEWKGKYILLNFWGEWCGPCMHEIPDLVKALNDIPREKFQIISFANTNRIDLIKKITTEKNMDWPQILLTNEMAKQFKVYGYPTNMLILPDGETYLYANAINLKFLMLNVK